MIILQNSRVDFGFYLETQRALGTVNIRSFFSLSDSFRLSRLTEVHSQDLRSVGARLNLSVHFKLGGKSLVVQLATLRTNNVILFHHKNLKQNQILKKFRFELEIFYLVRNAKKDLHHIGKHYTSKYDL